MTDQPIRIFVQRLNHWVEETHPMLVRTDRGDIELPCDTLSWFAIDLRDEGISTCDGDWYTAIYAKPKDAKTASITDIEKCAIKNFSVLIIASSQNAQNLLPKPIQFLLLSCFRVLPVSMNESSLQYAVK